MAEFRSWRNAKRTWLKDVVPLDTPYNIHIDTSATCNARCVYCGQSVTPGGGVMSMNLFQKVISDCYQFPNKIKIFDMYYTGEPLCNPYFADMVRCAKNSGLSEQVGVTTNALLFTEKRIDEVLAAGIDVIRISVQGLNAETYQRICGVKIDFEKFLSRLKYLYSRRGKCKIRIKIADLALENVEDGKEKFEKIFGNIADSIFVENIIPIYGDVKYDDLNSDINKNAKNGRYGLQQQQTNKVCYRPFIKLLVGVNGDVSAACCDHISGRDIVYGNVNNESLYDIWNGEVHKNIMKMQLEGKRFQHPLCKECVVPNDIAYEEDLLDPYVEDVLKRF